MTLFPLNPLRQFFSSSDTNLPYLNGLYISSLICAVLTVVVIDKDVIAL